jgi:hypothetical protein
MSIVQRPRRSARAVVDQTGTSQPADVFGVFGSTGYVKGPWGHAEANRLLAGHGRRHDPWVST